MAISVVPLDQLDQHLAAVATIAEVDPGRDSGISETPTGDYYDKNVEKAEVDKSEEPSVNTVSTVDVVEEHPEEVSKGEQPNDLGMTSDKQDLYSHGLNEEDTDKETVGPTRESAAEDMSLKDREDVEEKQLEHLHHSDDNTRDKEDTTKPAKLTEDKKPWTNELLQRYNSMTTTKDSDKDSDESDTEVEYTQVRTDVLLSFRNFITQK